MIDITKLNDRLVPHRHPAESPSPSSSSLTLARLTQPLWPTAKPRSRHQLLLFSWSQLEFLLDCPALIMARPPSRDHPLLKSLLSDLAKSCYWSSLIRPLILFILTHQLGCDPPLGRPSRVLGHLGGFFRKFFHPIEHPLALDLPLIKSSAPLRIAATPRRRIRSAKAFKCSGLVDLSDSSIQHHHNPPPSYLRRSNASRPITRSSLFIRPSYMPIGQLELERLSMLALCQMQRSPNCAPEDSLDGDQRHRRYYLVNSFRAKLASSTALKPQSSYSVWQLEDDDDEGLEPLEELLDWDSGTRRV